MNRVYTHPFQEWCILALPLPRVAPQGQQIQKDYHHPISYDVVGSQAIEQ